MSRGRAGFLAVCILAFIVVGAGLERVRQAVLAPVPVTAPLPELQHPPKIPLARPKDAWPEEAALRASLDALRRRVSELERALAARDAELAALTQEKPARTNAQPRAGRDDFRQRMEQMRKENPEQYAEIEKRREEFRQRIAQQEENRNSFLMSISTEGMGDAQRETHERLLATLARIDALRAQREQAGIEPGSQDDNAYREALRESMMELGPLYEQERVYLFEQAARAAGYEGEDAANFVGYIQEAIQSTAMPFGPFGGGGGFRSGGGAPRSGTP
jgi:hypothetical protein